MSEPDHAGALTVPVDVAFATSDRLGEGPVWHDGALHWVDILDGLIHRGDPVTGAVETVAAPTLIGAAAPAASGGYVIACAEGFGTVIEGVLDVRSAFLPDGVRMNDAKCDPFGQLWAGSNAMEFNAGAGALHVLRPDWSVETVLTGLTLPNGMGWSPDGATFYLIDTFAYELYAFEFGRAGPDVDRRRVLAQFDRAEGLPDGLCVDAQGDLWVARWGGRRIDRIGPDGQRLGRIDIPAVQSSSCAFGGADLDVLYVTSARDGLDLGDSDPDGSVFAVTGLGVSGQPGTVFAA